MDLNNRIETQDLPLNAQVMFFIALALKDTFLDE